MPILRYTLGDYSTSDSHDAVFDTQVLGAPNISIGTINTSQFQVSDNSGTNSPMFESDGTTPLLYTSAGLFVDFSDVNVNLQVSGGDYRDVAFASPAGSYLLGYGGNDILTGNTANDFLDGGSGNDALDGGVGSDFLSGGTGNDTYFIRDAGDSVNENAGEGADVVKATISYTLGDNVERLYLQNGGDIAGTGNSLVNLIIGNKGANHLNGKDGNDVLTGGGGHDVFVFDTTPNGTTNHDRITDFNLSEDRIGLGPDIFQGVDLDRNGALDAGQFAVIDATSKPNAEAHLFYRSDKGALYYDADGYGGQQYKAVLVAVFDGKPALEASFFDVLQP